MYQQKKISKVIEKQNPIINIGEYKEIKEKSQKRLSQKINFKSVSLPIITYASHEERECFKKLLNRMAV